MYRGEPKGLQFSNLSDAGNGIPAVWIIFIIEWPLFMLLAWYLEQVVNSGAGTSRHWLYCLPWKCGGVSQGGGGEVYVGGAGMALAVWVRRSGISEKDT